MTISSTFGNFGSKAGNNHTPDSRFVCLDRYNPPKQFTDRFLIRSDEFPDFG